MATGVTPGRSTVVTLDSPDVYSQEKTIFIEKNLKDIALPSTHRRYAATPSGTLADAPYNVTFTDQHGWHLASQLVAGEEGYETDNFDTGDVGLTTHSSIFSRPVYRDNTDLAGITLGTNQQSSGHTVFQKEIGASGTFAGELSADRTAYPPASMDEIQPLYRLAVSTSDSLPTDRIGFSYHCYGSTSFSRLGALCRIYFTSLAGHTEGDGTKIGTGQYHLTIFGSGRAVLHELLQDGASYEWTERNQFIFARPGEIKAGYYGVAIYSDATNIDGIYTGSRICFKLSHQAGIINAAIEAVQDHPHVYSVPGANTYQPQPEKIRFDDRADVRSSFKIVKSIYYREGKLKTYGIDTRYPISDVEPLYVIWFGNCPAGCSVTVECFDAETGTALSTSGLADSGKALGYQGFDPTSGRTADTVTKKYSRTKYYAILTLTSPDGVQTPLIRTVRFFRNLINVVGTPTPVELASVQSISITGQDSDPTHETAMIKCTDLTGDLTLLDTRAGMPIKVEIAGIDSGDPLIKSALFNGYVLQAPKSQKGGLRGLSYPVDRWASYDIRCSGEWHRLFEAQATQTYNFGIDFTIKDTPTPWKITDIIRTLIKDAGYSEDNILVDDIDLRLFGSGDINDLLLVEVHTPIFPIIMTLAMQYLGGWIDFDGNASGSATPDKMGAWRLHLAPRPNGSGLFRTLAKFTRGTNNTGAGLRLGYQDTYQETVAGIDGQTMKTIWARKGTITEFVVPPEANAVMVTGTGLNPKNSILSKLGTSDESPLTQTALNFTAAKFFDGQPIDPDPDSPDYTNGRPVWIYVGDPSFQSQQAVDFYCRRIYDLACHAQNRKHFEAPLLLVTDVNDEYQRQPRPLKYGDPVFFEDEVFIVGNCSPDWSSVNGGSRMMMARYELFQPADLDSWKSAGHWR